MVLHDNRKISEIVSKNLESQKNLKNIRIKLLPYTNRNIIVLSRDEGTREAIVLMLKSLGFPNQNISITNFANQVANQIKTTKSTSMVICDLILQESKLPSISATKFYLNIKNNMRVMRKVLVVPFIVMASSIEKKEIMAGYSAGIGDFVVLPTNEIVLGKKILGLFQNKKEDKISQEVRRLIREGDEFQQQGILEMAINRYDEALKVGGENAEVLTKKGDVLFKEGNYDEAISIYKQAANIEKNLPRTHQGLGNCFSFQGNYHSASVHYKNVLQYEPKNLTVLNNMGQINLEKRDYNEAIKYFEKGIKINASSANNHVGMAKAYEGKNQIENALQCYQNSIKAQPKQQHLYIAAGNFCLKHNQFDIAENIFTKGIELDVKYVYMYNRLGIVLRKQKKYKEALNNYHKALKIDPKDAAIHYNIGKAWVGASDFSKAKQSLQKAFTLDSGLKDYFEKDTDFDLFKTEVKKF